MHEKQQPRLIMQDDIEDCIISLALVWITLSMLPSLASKRWATGKCAGLSMSLLPFVTVSRGKICRHGSLRDHARTMERFCAHDCQRVSFHASQIKICERIRSNTHNLLRRRYFEKRWAAYPLDRLAAEVSISTGRTERPSTVSEWSRLVYATLENVAPQWPSE